MTALSPPKTLLGKKEKKAVWYRKNAAIAKAMAIVWAKNNPEKKREHRAKWNAANPDKVKACRDKWIARNQDKVRMYQAKYHWANVEKRMAATARWLTAHPEYGRIKEQNRRAKKKQNGGVLSKGLAAKLFKLQKGKCACGCAKSLGKNYHMDHRMPLHLGGANEDWNIQLLRGSCNDRKGIKHPIEFMQSMGFLL